MATVVGALNIQMGLATAKFTSGTKKVTSGLGRIGSAVTSAKGLMVGFAGAAGIGLVINKLRTLVTEQLNALDALGKFAARMGTTADAIAGLQFAAERSGTSTDIFNRSFEKMIRTIGEAKQGIGEGKRAFETLGLSIESVTRIKSVPAFIRIADSISKLDSVTQQAAVSNQIFGRSGVQMLNFLNEGESGIRRLTDRFGELNGTFGTSTDEAQKAVDAMTDMNVVIDKMKRQIAVEATPAVKGFSSALTDMGTNIGKITVHSNALANALIIYDNWKWKSELAATGVQHLSDAVIDLSGWTDDLADSMERSQKFIDSLAEKVKLFGLTGLDRQLAKLKLGGLIDPGQLEQIEGLLESLKKLEERKKFFERGGPGQLFGTGPLEIVPELSAFEFNEAFDALIGSAVVKATEAGEDIGRAILGDNQALVRGSSEAVGFLRQQQRRQPLKSLEQIAKDQLAVLKKIEEKPAPAPPIPVAILGDAF